MVTPALERDSLQQCHRVASQRVKSRAIKSKVGERDNAFMPLRFRLSPQANLKDVSDQVNSVVTDAEQESILTRLFQKVTLTVDGTIW